MKPEEVIDYFGSLTATAVAMHVSPQCVHAWRKRGAIPLRSQALIEHKTGGELKVDLPTIEETPTHVELTAQNWQILEDKIEQVDGLREHLAHAQSHNKDCSELASALRKARHELYALKRRLGVD